MRKPLCSFTFQNEHLNVNVCVCLCTKRQRRKVKPFSPKTVKGVFVVSVLQPGPCVEQPAAGPLGEGPLGEGLPSVGSTSASVRVCACGTAVVRVSSPFTECVSPP